MKNSEYNEAQSGGGCSPPGGFGRRYHWPPNEKHWFNSTHGTRAGLPGVVPDEVGSTLRRPRGLLESLRKAHGHSWYGPVSCSSRRDPATRFFVLVHEHPDGATAMIYCDESKTGPAEIVSVLPARLRPQLRTDFPFEFLSFARFLGAIGAGCELQVHDAIAAAIADAGEEDSLVFSIGSGLWPSDRELVLSECVEAIAVTLLEWLEEK